MHTNYTNVGYADADRALLTDAALNVTRNQAALAAIQTAIAAIQAKQEQIMAAIDDFITSMTMKMASETTEIASLKIFIQGLFDQIRIGVPALTPAQQTALDSIQASADANAAGITAAMVDTPPLPPTAA